MTRRLGLVVALALPASSGCERIGASTSAASGSSAAARASAAAEAAGSALRPTAADRDAAASSALERGELARLFGELSEPDRYFFSDNYVSNETSYLQVAEELDRRAKKHAAYLGVGPEQNFTYIAITEPEIAFIVDIRRGNALEHLLYKAAFDGAETRSHFLATLIGRQWQREGDPGPDASIEQVLAHAEKTRADDATFSRIHAQLLERITRDYGVRLSASDRKTLLDTGRALFEKGLGLRFELKEHNGRKYPSLGELLAQRSPEGRALGYLASERAFRTVQALERDHRIIPVVGDFAGKHALAKIAEELRRRHLEVSVFYTSNVEQYLMEPAKWKAWIKNIEALPTDEQSLFLRCYLDQGRKHPAQMAGHRTTTLLQSMRHFLERQRTRGYASFFQLVTDEVPTMPSGR
jgi:hypothetical protein